MSRGVSGLTDGSRGPRVRFKEAIAGSAPIAFVLGILVLVLSLPAFAAAVLREQDILDVVANEVVVRLQVPRRDVEVEWQDINPSSLVPAMPEGRISFQVGQGTRLGGRGPVAVQILVDGRKFRTIFPKLEVRVFQVILVAKNRIPRGTMVTEGDIVARREAVTGMNLAPLTDPRQAVGTEATRDIPAGTMLVSQLFKTAVLVKPGDEVTVTVASGGLTITTTGTARSSGGLGQMVRVANRETRTEFLAKVIGPNQVELRLAE